MKDIKEYLNNEPIKEGWVGSEGNKAYDEIIDAVQYWDGPKVIDMIWNYFNDTQLRNLYKWMKEDEYI